MATKYLKSVEAQVTHTTQADVKTRVSSMLRDLEKNGTEAALRYARELDGWTQSVIVADEAYEHAEASFVSPFDYGQLLGATVVGYLVFAEFPDLWTWVGAAIIIVSGIYVARREALLRRRVNEEEREA